jgi:hypothetical protein
VLVLGTLWSPENGAQLVGSTSAPAWLAVLAAAAAVTLTRRFQEALR